MAQKRHIEYKADDISFQFNEFLIGIIPPGLYRGFEFNPTSNLFLELNHQITGFLYPKKNGTMTPKIGVVRSKQGVLITEDSLISLQVNANVTANPRIDLVICEHKYEEIIEGLEAEYIIIQGTPNESPVTPTLTNPNFQVIIGELYLPAGTSTLDAVGVVYTRPQLPELGNNNLQEQQDILQQNFDALQQNFDILQQNFVTLSQIMSDWRTYYRPVMQFNGVYIEWKWFGSPVEDWESLAEAIVVDCSGPGTMEVRILESQYLPNAEVWNIANPTQRDHNVLEFNTVVSLPNATYWINNREWIAPQTKNYRFLLDTMKLVCFKNIDVAALDSANEFPFLYGSSTKTWWQSALYGVNGFIRIELVKNETDIVFSTFYKFQMPDGALIGDEILISVIDEIISATAGDHFIWRVSIMPNYNNPSEGIPDAFNYYNAEGFVIQGNTAWVQRNHYQIESGHWTIFGL